MSETLKLMYATDHTLLQRCAKDPLFSSYSVVIVDEAHERSIFTDLLLGMLKKAVLQRTDLRVIIELIYRILYGTLNYGFDNLRISPQDGHSEELGNILE